MKHTLLIITILSIHIGLIYTDLPVHCLSGQIEGDWLLHMSSNDSDSDLKCGHKNPDQNLDHYDVNIEETFKVKYETLVHLERPNVVQQVMSKGPLGTWTMIYDEGFELRFSDHVFFAFSRYEKVGKFSPTNTDTEDTPGYRNICEKTFVGWYHDKENKGWGCFWAEKVDKGKYDLAVIDYNNLFKLSRVPNKGVETAVVVPHDNMLIMNQAGKNNIQQKQQSDLTNMLGSYVKQTNDYNPNFNVPEQTVTPSNSFVDFVKSLGWGSNSSSASTGNYLNIPHLDIYFDNNNTRDPQQNFLEVEAKTFSPDLDFVERVNDPTNGYKWTAKVYDDFIGKSYSQMRHLLGNKNPHKSASAPDPSFLELSVDVSLGDKAKKSNLFNSLPKSFDWRSVDGISYDSPIRKQGECGSCYAIAAVSVLESRIRIKTNNRMKPILSPSSIVSCSRYNQGCAGGYPFLVGKHAKEFGFVEESCQPYAEADDKCLNFCYHQKLFKAKDYG
jgi:hypothetical protein